MTPYPSPPTGIVNLSFRYTHTTTATTIQNTPFSFSISLPLTLTTRGQDVELRSKSHPSVTEAFQGNGQCVQTDRNTDQVVMLRLQKRMEFFAIISSLHFHDKPEFINLFNQKSHELNQRAVIGL
ncbi:hypothetical protein AVEN_183288-1 [Araneus ventricosus]|uniref:Uncharacterized protein n=1 Tax=Araneus ventricosus TaxID=182803 RepID=A0A4Y2ERL3_ARAVE|nr:hypothetical protein AVEN_183288-1 [Araneus ventricosus]